MRGRLIWGVALIAMGAFFLAQQLGLFGARAASLLGFCLWPAGIDLSGDLHRRSAPVVGADSRLHPAGRGAADRQRAKTSSSRLSRQARCSSSASVCRSC